MNRIIVTLLTMSTFALASSAENTGTDIVQRTVNFLLFAALVWYLVAEPVKGFFKARSEKISDELKKVQDKLTETITLKKDALAKISDAEKFAEELTLAAKKENKMINDNMMLQCKVELGTLTKQHTVLKEFEQRKMLRNVVEDILDEVLSQSNDSFDKEAMANVILKKVA